MVAVIWLEVPFRPKEHNCFGFALPNQWYQPRLFDQGLVQEQLPVTMILRPIRISRILTIISGILDKWKLLVIISTLIGLCRSMVELI